MAIQGALSDVLQTANWIGAGRLAVLALAGFGAFHLIVPPKHPAPIVIRKPDCVMPFQTVAGGAIRLFIPCEIARQAGAEIERPINLRGVDADVKPLPAKTHYDRILPENNVTDIGVKADKKRKRK
jgi:hypothetical protein